MNNFKKIIAIASCAAMVLSFAACSGAKAPEETTTQVKTTVAETTTNPLHSAETRFSHLANMNVWTKGKKVSYKEGERKIGAATAALNDSVKNDKFSASKKKISLEQIDAMKKTASCIELVYAKEQTGNFVGETFKYDQFFVAMTGDNVNTIVFLKGGKIVNTIDVTKESSEKTISENVSSAVEVVTIPEDHTH